MSPQKVKKGSADERGDVAIIGMACTFPGAPDLNSFWQNIVDKVDAVTDVPPDRWDAEIFFDPESTENDRVYCKRGGYLREPPQFNPTDHGIMPIAVDGGDPTQFLALKVTKQALDDAGYSNRLDNRERVAIILGRGNYLDRGICNATQHSRVAEQTIQILKNLHPEYTQEELQAIKKEIKASLPNFGPENSPSLIPNITTGRISNRLDFMGPNFTIDAACASSLIATELGISNLLTKKCDLVLAGGIFIIPDVLFSIIFCQLQALSKKSEIRPFDKNADGTIIGEGVGIIVLKRLEDAERDGDRIYAVIKGSGTSSDGRGYSVTAPRLEGAELALRRAYEISGISPQTIGIIEAHGTGTPAGDTTEIEALIRVFGTRDGSYPRCALGTVKSMIGHAMPAAGAAGIIKTALALYHKVLPPTLHCEEPHPKLKDSPFYINSETRPWIHGEPETPRRAGINAFGFGGINAHMLLEEYVSADESRAPNHLLHWETEVCILQGQSRHSLIQRAQQLEQYLQANPQIPLKDLAYTLNTDLQETSFRLAVIASSPEDLAQKLRYAIQRMSDPECTQIKDIKGIYFFEQVMGRDAKLAFLFPGEGSQYVNMLADLCIHFPEVRACFDEADTPFIDHPRGYLPSQIIFPPPTFTKEERSEVESAIWQMDNAIESVSTANKAIFSLLTQLQIQPDIVVGHSTGELSAIFAAGITEMDTRRIHKLRNIYERLTQEDKIPEADMVAVGAGYAVVSDIIDKINGNIFIAMDNCPHQVVVVGEHDAIKQAIDMFQTTGLIHEKLHFNRAYHTPLFDVVAEHFREFYSEQAVCTPKMEMWSCTMAQPYPQDAAQIQELAVNHWMRPVRFRETIEAMYGAGVRTFVEVGPRSNLTAFVDDILRDKPHIALASNIPRRSGITQLNHLIGLLAAQGILMHLDYLYTRRAPRQLTVDEVYKTADAEDSTGSIALPLGFPPMNISPRKPTIAGKEKHRVHSKETVEPRQTTAFRILPTTPQEQNAASTLEPTLGFEGQIPTMDDITKKGNVSGDSMQPMEDYFSTMQKFLEVQQYVMQAYLNRKRATSESILEHEQVTAKKTIATQKPQGTDANESLDLPSTEVEEKQAPETSVTTCESLTQAFLQLVSDRTGYPVEMIDVNLDMEADLGIDSIKRAEILGTFREEYNLLQTEIDIEQIAELKTIQQLIDFFTEQLIESESNPSAPKQQASNEQDNILSGTSKDTIALEAHPQEKSSGMNEEEQTFPFIGTIISHVPGRELIARRRIDMREDIFLHDHVIGGQISVTDSTLRPPCVVPMTVSMEIMAEAAAKLAPNETLIAMKNVVASRWIFIGEKPTNLLISALKQTPDTKEVHVKMWDIGDDAETEPTRGSPAAEGTMVFANMYPQSPAAEVFSLRAERPPKYSAEDLYRERIMFHGPRFQGVANLDGLGEDGILGQIKALTNTDIFQSNPNPLFITDPFLIDAAGQLVGYWPMEYLETGFVAFPVGLKELRLFGPKPHPFECLGCQVRIREVTSSLLRADIDVIGPDNRVNMRLIGWEDRRFNWASELFNIYRNIQSVVLSSPWDIPISKFPLPESFECYRFNIVGSYPSALKDLWANLILSRKEREIWQNLRLKEARQMKWLSGRLVAKDAARMFLKKHSNLELCPADIEVVADEHGRPMLEGTWAQQVMGVPELSLAHTDGLAVAVVGYCSNSQRIGIDVEPIRQHTPQFDRLSFLPEEQALLLSLDESMQEEWRIRLWCAKEAVAKALGRGLNGNPQNLAVQQLSAQTGVVTISLQGKLAKIFPEFAGAQIVAYTAREENYVIASSLCERG